MDYDDRECRLAGGCPELPQFDVVRPQAGIAGTETVAVYVREDMTALPAGVAYTHPDMGYQTVNLGFGGEYMLGDGEILPGGVYSTGIGDRVDLIENIMEYFGKEPTGTPTGAPEGFSCVTWLGGAYPNPFNPLTRIEYALAEPGRVALRVYNLAGRRVATLVDGPVTAGEHIAVWDGRTEGGRRAASGVYFVRMEAPGYEATRTMVLLK
jgi:hypothetical protein